MAGLSANASRLTDLGTTSPQAVGFAMLQADPHAWRLDRDQQLAAVSEALADGAATAQQALGSDAMNISLPPSTDISQIALYFLSSNAAPKGRNWANWKNEEFDMLIDRIEKSSDKAQILKDTQRAHEIIVDEAPWAFIVHDRNPRAMTKKVKGFVSAQSWFQDFTSVDME